MSLNSRTCILALGLLLISANYQQLVSAGPSPLDDDYTDNFIEATRIVFATPGRAPVGFDETKNALEVMHKELQAEDVKQVEYLSSLKLKIDAFVDVCKLEKSKCLTVFGRIDSYLRDEADNEVNLVPYLNECSRRQTIFCTGSDPDKKPNNVEKFFGKLVTACWPKNDRNCAKKA